ncbi:hypothetical protein C2R22_13125 [Salinigranum rubrum]|uniref:4-vinyl reductase 4VR domain-containing protein n=1 Tax=Salinigranum rubrum TaxID=755307 RepID=A0A2I8VKL1_9EURY|nr:hypothetical protein [Salinigranum rubrum]AUV82467.1 hypothetical protein C2R22_13125 [Salinigranum rubrum]
MATYEAFDPDIEVHGRTIRTVVDDALTRFSDEYQQLALDALADNGVEDPSPDEWYPQQAWLNTFERIAEATEPHILDRLGEQIPDVVDWPSGVSSVEAGLTAIDDAYQLNHRGSTSGAYRFEPVDDQVGKMVCENPYPCPFDRGLIRAVARRYAPIEAFVFVEERGETCRRKGDDECTYTVSW